jgi:hypothetical protein
MYDPVKPIVNPEATANKYVGGRLVKHSEILHCTVHTKNVHSRLEMPTVVSSVLTSRASPISILMAATSKHELKETTRTIPNQVDKHLMANPQCTLVISTSVKRSVTGTGGATSPTQPGKQVETKMSNR